MSTDVATTVGIDVSAPAIEHDRASVELRAATHLHGPRNILQGGLAAGLLLVAARSVDTFGAPVTAIDAELRAPTPLDVPVTAELRRAAAAVSDVAIRADGRVVVEGRVELAGHALDPEVGDLQGLATVPLPAPHEQERFPVCWVCGAHNPRGLKVLPGYAGEGLVVSTYWPDPSLAGDRGALDPLVVTALLDCPTTWASMHAVDGQGASAAMLASYHVRFFADAPLGEPLRTVARFDAADGRKLRARSALVDEDGTVYAVAAALQIAVRELPELPAPPRH